jgi:hypothetical protein
MVVTSVSKIFDMYLTMFRTTEYKQLQDEVTKKKVTQVEQNFQLDLYNSKGKIETHKV